MQRCNNVTISSDNIQEVECKARDLLASLNDIHFVMTVEEQQGLFSIIHALEWEPITSGRTDQEEPSLKRDDAVTGRLRQLLTRYHDQ
jgi:hypothetical protein